MATEDTNTGVIALLLVIVVLLVGGFLWYELGTDNDIDIQLPEVREGGVTRDAPAPGGVGDGP